MAATIGESGKTTKSTDMVFITTAMVISMKANSHAVSSMAKVLTSTHQAIITLESTSLISSMVTVSYASPTVTSTMAFGREMSSVEEADTFSINQRPCLASLGRESLFHSSKL